MHQTTFKFFLQIFRYLFFILIVGLFSACSVERDTWYSRNWHNMLAKYNGYFLAREKMKETEQAMLKSQTENFNRILEIYAQPKPGGGLAYAAAMDEVIKKASIPIQRHKNSDWVDDSYMLIGKARYYKEDFDNAIQTFKYVNTKSPDKNTRHQALVWLLRTYTRTEEYGLAHDVIAYLKKQKLNKENLRDASIAAAYLKYRLMEYDLVRDYLYIAAPLMKKGDARNRIFFILGQLNQRFKDYEDAYASYKYVIKHNPTYDLGFHAKLNLAQVSNYRDAKERELIEKMFKKLLRDPNNVEYESKILYEMGMYEYKQNKINPALELFQKSLKTKITNPNQKGYSYLRLGEIHYEKLKKYVPAAAYYDSCVAVLDTADENYKSIVRRKNILSEFVEQYTIIETEDSLQRLAKSDTNTIYAIVDKMIEEELDKKRKEEREARKAQRRAIFGSSEDGSNDLLNNMMAGAGSADAKGQSGTWYFYDLGRLASGQSEFRKKWGNRKLEDNWRRSTKESTSASDGDDNTASKEDLAQNQPSEKGSNKDTPKPDDGKDVKEGGKKGAKEVELSKQQMREPYLANIPFTEEQLTASHERLRMALFKIGKIYDQKLEEKDNAIKSFIRLYENYKDFEKTPESVYNLCIIYQKADDKPNFEKWKAVLLNEYPHTVFAKLIENPNYLVENKARNRIISQLYAQAYEQYKKSLYIEASQGLASIKQQYPENDYADKIEVLGLLIQGKTLDINTYRQGLANFIEKYPKSSMIPFVEQLLKNCDNFITGKPLNPIPTDEDQAANGKPKVVYNTDLNKGHVFVAVFPLDAGLSEEDIKVKFSDYNNKFYSTETFTITTLLLGDNKHFLVKIQTLPSKIQAMNYLAKQQGSNGALKKQKLKGARMYVMTPDNFIIFYKSKDLNQYEEFFKKNYPMDEFEEIPTFGQ